MFTNNLIKDNNLSSTVNFIKEGTAVQFTPFELKLQLHGEVSNPYNFNIDNNYNIYGNINKPKIFLHCRDIEGNYLSTIEYDIPENKYLYFNNINAPL